MALPEDMKPDITLRLEGSVSVPQLTRALDALHSLLRRGYDRLCPDEAISWKVQVKEGSNLVELRPSGAPQGIDAAETVMRQVGDAVGLLQVTAERPKGLDNDMIDSLRELSSMGARKKDNLRIALEVRERGKAATTSSPLTPQVRLNLKKLRKAELRGFEESGSVRGRLLVLDVHTPGPPQARVCGPLFGKGVRCLFEEGALFEKARELFTRRVHAEGIVKYRAAGLPYEILVQQLRGLPEESELPDYRAARGILKGHV